ncbi:hypothetical protein HY631_04015 [Candidatus Uhrbacteria bacterium]|nr:hypothetical protein [Candidatus Uhrbacteria bacterium]
MFSFFAIPIIGQATTAAAQSASYFDQPIDAILFDFLIWFGWIPIAVTLAWGFTIVWQDYRQGLYSAKLKFTYLAVDVPSMTEQTPKAMENFYANLYGTKSSLTWKEIWIDGKLHPVFSFEIVSTEGYIQFVIRTQTRFRDVVEAGIYAHYPDAQISEIEDYTLAFPSDYPNDEYEMWGGEMTLDRDSMYPIRTYVNFEDRISQEIKDPLGYTLEQLATMRPGEHFWIQILAQPSTNDWMKKGLKYVNTMYGVEEKKKKSFLDSASESLLTIPNEILKEAMDVDLSGLLLPGGEAKEADVWKAFKISPAQKEEAEAILLKAGKVGLGVKIRVIYIAKKNAFVKVERTGIVKGIWSQFTHLNLNKFTLYIPQVPKDDYFWMRWVYTKKQKTLMTGYKKRGWGIGANPVFLNTEELATLWHFPAISIKAPLVKKSESKRGEPPAGLPMTFVEQSLPGAPDIFAPEEEGAPSFLGAGIAEPESDEPLSETLPHPVAPTEENADTNDDGFVPPNLPT